jgi:hypothetical protein
MTASPDDFTLNVQQRGRRITFTSHTPNDKFQRINPALAGFAFMHERVGFFETSRHHPLRKTGS